MSQILRDLNKLAEKMGAPVVGQNISEQIRAISTFYGGTSHGANINERINEVRQAYHGGEEPTPNIGVAAWSTNAITADIQVCEMEEL